jgi:hypothetical protein
LTIPTIGTGFGKHCDGQILVTHDLIGLFPVFTPRFVSPEARVADEIRKPCKFLSGARNPGKIDERMKLPRFMASIVAVLLLMSALQAVSWVNRPPPDWHSAWWQTHLWADIGGLLMAPSMVLPAVFSALLRGIDSSLFARGFVSGLGFAVYLVIVYVMVCRGVRLIISLIKQFDYTPPKNSGDSN